MRILIAEDEPEFRQLLAEALTREGHTVETATDGREGVYKFRTGEFDTVISDWNMPRQNGFSMVTDIFRLKPSTHVIMMSGDCSNRPPAGVAMLYKPFALRDLLEKLNSL